MHLGAVRERAYALVHAILIDVHEQLEAKGDVSEDDIKAWLEEKPEAEKNRLQIYDTNRVALVMGISRFEQFDPEQWTEQLADFEMGDQQLEQLYNQVKDSVFKN